MIDEKIIDAVGMLNEELLYQASSDRKKHSRIKNIAAVLAIIFIPAAVILSGFYIFGHIEAGVNSADPAYKYSYDSGKLLMICRLNLNSADDNAADGEYDYKELYEHVGAGIFGVEYADGEKVVITTGKGIFVYDYKLDYMINNFDLDKIGVPGFNQGDSSSSIRVDKSGDYCVMQSCEFWTNPDRKIEYRIINFKNGEITQISEDDIPNDFLPFETEELDFYSKENKNLPFGHAGSITASFTDSNGEKLIFYTNIESSMEKIEVEGTHALVGYTELVIVKPDKSYITQRIFASMFEEFEK